MNVDEATAGVSAAAVARALTDGEPGIRVGVGSNTLVVNPQLLEKDEESIIAERLRQALRVPVCAGR